MKVNAGNMWEADELTDEDFERLAVHNFCCDSECETLEKLGESSTSLYDMYEYSRDRAVKDADALASLLKDVYEVGMRYGRANP